MTQKHVWGFSWQMLIILVFGRQRREEMEFKGNLSYVASLRTAWVISQKNYACMCLFLENSWVGTFPCHRVLNNMNIGHLALHSTLVVPRDDLKHIRKTHWVSCKHDDTSYRKLERLWVLVLNQSMPYRVCLSSASVVSSGLVVPLSLLPSRLLDLAIFLAQPFCIIFLKEREKLLLLFSQHPPCLLGFPSQQSVPLSIPSWGGSVRCSLCYSRLYHGHRAWENGTVHGLRATCSEPGSFVKNGGEEFYIRPRSWWEIRFGIVELSGTSQAESIAREKKTIALNIELRINWPWTFCFIIFIIFC